MASRRDFLAPFISNANKTIVPGSLQAPPEEIVALNRITYGATQDTIDKVRKKGLTAFIEEQLNPDDKDDKLLKEKLSSFKLPIKYSEVPGKYPAVDEERALLLLDAPIEKLWSLVDNKTSVAGPERTRALDEVRAGSWLRAVYSQWQLREIMVEFWHNHFNVNALADAKITVTFPLYDHEVIRKHCLGNFRAFLEDVAKSPSMLYYLDNFNSKASPANENFARELFELHTLGAEFYFNDLYNRWRDVPGALEGKPVGYIDEDVYEAARAFTGWTVADGSSIGRDKLPHTGAFHYHDGWHDNYQKRVLGVEFPPNQPALSDGTKVLDLVAYHPATAKHICKKLCRRFIADEPPESVVNGAAEVWTKHREKPDQIKQTLKYILASKEFRTSWGKKVRRPFDLMAAIFRMTASEFAPHYSLNNQLLKMGYYHFNWISPTGHPDSADYWLSSTGMLARWNAATTIMTARYNNSATFNFNQVMPKGLTKPYDIATFWINRLLQKEKPKEFVNSVAEFMAGNNKLHVPMPADQIDKRVGHLIALITMTPDFQLV